MEDDAQQPDQDNNVIYGELDNVENLDLNERVEAFD